MAQQSVIGEGDEECHHRIDLRALGLIDELEHAEQGNSRVEAGAVVPEPPAEVVDQP